MTQADLDKLEFVKLKIPRLIPEHLIEDVKGRTFSPEQFFKYQEAQINNAGNHLFALVDNQKKIWGFLWAESNMLDNTLFVNTFSIDKSYWGKGAAIEKAVNFVRSLSENTKAPATLWITSNAKFFTKHGFRPSRSVLMEHRGTDPEKHRCADLAVDPVSAQSHPDALASLSEKQ